LQVSGEYADPGPIPPPIAQQHSEKQFQLHPGKSFSGALAGTASEREIRVIDKVSAIIAAVMFIVCESFQEADTLEARATI
jgi:hypothetical protein